MLGGTGTVLTFLLAAALAEVPATTPDPAGIELPPIAFSNDPGVLHDGDKFYFFHNPSVSFAEAYQDFRECRGYLAPGAPPRVPGFVPFGAPHHWEVPPVVPAYGLVGQAILAIVMPKLERGMRSNKLRRCLGTRGYVRYPIPGESWHELNTGDE